MKKKSKNTVNEQIENLAYGMSLIGKLVMDLNDRVKALEFKPRKTRKKRKKK